MSKESTNHFTDDSPQVPLHYPTQPVEDSFQFIPDDSSVEERKQAYLDWCLKNPSPEGTKTPFFEIVRLAKGLSPNQRILQDALQQINQRPDCADFGMQVVLWLLYKFPDSPLVEPELMQYARQVVLDFKYWPEESGQDDMCTWTENHQILFATAAYLFGQMFPDEIFTNSGQTGKEKMQRNHSRIMRWLELRFQTGFSEWLSNVYYAEDLPALVSLIEFCEDDAIMLRAKMVVDVLLLDIAANSFHGIFASTHGRSYERHKISAGRESTSPICKMMFGMGEFRESLCAVPFALSTKYEIPPVLMTIGEHLDESEFVNQQRCGILLNEAEKLGLKFDNFEDAMRFLSLEAYLHPKTAGTNLAMFDAFDWWRNSFLRPIKPFRKLLMMMKKFGILPAFLRAFEWDVCRNTREAVDLMTYRTPYYMLSSAQEYRVGYGGDQQSIWQATIGEDATCFTTHPGGAENGTPDNWTGSGILPHVRQVKNVLLCVYHLHRKPALYQKTVHAYTHAWLPKAAFDDYIEQNGWCFTRKGNSYLAIRSMLPMYWANDHELIAEGRKNAWIVELGSTVEYASFEDFVQQISQAVVSFNRFEVTYHSPTQGKLSLKWKGAFRQNNQVVEQQRYPRYQNDYVTAQYPAEELLIQKGKHALYIDFKKNLREIK